MGILIPAELGEVAARGDPDPGGQKLDQEAHDGGPHQEPEERVARDGPRLEIPLEIPRIQKSYAHQEPRPSEEPQLLP